MAPKKTSGKPGAKRQTSGKRTRTFADRAREINSQGFNIIDDRGNVKHVGGNG